MAAACSGRGVRTSSLSTSAAARGSSEEEAAAEMAALPRSPVQLARKLFAQVFSGVHW